MRPTSAFRILADAKATAEAGFFAVVVEGVAEALARDITAAVDVPTIGIGASAGCDGPIRVTAARLGLFDWTPKFVRRYGDLRADIGRAVEAYAEDVRTRRFPGPRRLFRPRRLGSFSPLPASVAPRIGAL